ncbi:MAG: CoA-binding protein, partial [Candidatus Bathyarchaeia archaeon]
MPILVDESSRVIVQGITGAQGSFHTRQMLEYGTRIVAGVTPGKGGTEVLGVSVYDTVEEAIAREEADVSIIFVPAPFAKGAVFEAIEAHLKTIIVITEHIPIKDSVEFLGRANQSGITVIGPNTPGVITAGQTKIGIMPAQVFKPGTVGIVSRSGTLTYEIASRITNSGLGETTCVGIGGDPITGCGFVDVLQRFVNDEMTQAVVLVGEIGGNAEELAAEYIGT